MKTAGEIDADMIVPIFKAGVEKGCGARDARIVHEDIDAAEACDSLLDHRIDVLAIARIHMNRQRVAAIGHDCVCGLLRAFLKNVRDDNACAVLGQGARDDGADAAS